MTQAVSSIFLHSSSKTRVVFSHCSVVLWWMGNSLWNPLEAFFRRSSREKCKCHNWMAYSLGACSSEIWANVVGVVVIDSLVSPDRIACIDAMVSLVLWYPLWDNIVHKMGVRSHVIHTPSTSMQLCWAANWTQLEQLFSSSSTNLPNWRLEVEIRIFVCLWKRVTTKQKQWQWMCGIVHNVPPPLLLVLMIHWVDVYEWNKRRICCTHMKWWYYSETIIETTDGFIYT